MTTRKGYLVAAAVFVLGLGLAAIMMWRLYSRVEGMPRIDMPGEQTVTLPAGEVIAFAERASGQVGAFSVSANCAAVDSTGATVEVTAPGSNTSYTFGSRKGVSLLALRVATAGPVTVRCESGDRFVLAFGDGLGRHILMIVLAALVGGFGATIITARTWWRRRRERKQAPATAG